MAKEFKGAEDVFGTPLVLTIDEKEWTFSPIELGDYAWSKRHLRQQQLQTYDEYLEEMLVSERPPPSEARQQRSDILRTFYSDMEVVDWWNTSEGSRYWLWLSLKKKHKDITVEEISEMISDPEKLSQMADAVAAISGFVITTDKDSGEVGSEEDLPQNGKAISPASSDSTPDSTSESAST